MMKPEKDAFGAELLVAYKAAGNTGWEIIERDDGLMDASAGPSRYFSDYDDWSKRERQGIKLARGRVLDIGCGAGRFALYLQRKGLDVIAIDNSPGAVKVCKLRGVKKAMVRSIAEIGKFKPESFDTIVMMAITSVCLAAVRKQSIFCVRCSGLLRHKARLLEKPQTLTKPVSRCICNN